MILGLVMAVVLQAEEPINNPRLEDRAQHLMREIRCVVCENEPVSQSNADVAVQMRKIIREQVAAGQSDGQIRKYFSDRYGAKVLFRPPEEGLGLVIWLFPVALMGSALAWVFLRRRPAKVAGLAPLSESEVSEGAGEGSSGKV